MWLFLYLDAPSSPGMVRLSAIKSRSLEITWSRPHDGNSPILNYIIEYSNLPGKLQISMPLAAHVYTGEPLGFQLMGSKIL